MNILQFTLAASLMLLATSCDKSQKTDSSVQREELITLADTAMAPAYGNAGKDEEQRQPGGKNSPEQHNDWDKKIIKTATISLEVDNYAKYNGSIHQLVKEWEAYISNEEENKNEYRIDNVLTIKIPVQFFDEAVRQLSAQPGKLLTKQITSQDVTGEYIDTRARMEAKKRVRLRYLDMLQKAKNMEEILQVEREVNALQEQIEAAEGRVNYLSHSAAYSTIQLTFSQILDAKAIDRENPGFGKRVLLAITNGAKWVSELLIVLITLWPAWLALVLGIWALRKITRPKNGAGRVAA